MRLAFKPRDNRGTEVKRLRKRGEEVYEPCIKKIAHLSVFVWGWEKKRTNGGKAKKKPREIEESHRIKQRGGVGHTQNGNISRST